MIPALVFDTTTIYLMIPAPPNATTVSASKSGTLVFAIKDANGTSIPITVTEVSTWGFLTDGYAKVRLKHADTSPKLGPAIAYQKTGGNLIVTFS